MSSRDWRCADDYRELEGLSLKDLAWEYLRRNPDYVADYCELAAQVRQGADERERIAAWGLRFRSRPFALSDDRARLLVASINAGSDDHSAPRRPLRRKIVTAMLASSAA